MGGRQLALLVLSEAERAALAARRKTAQFARHGAGVRPTRRTLAQSGGRLMEGNHDTSCEAEVAKGPLSAGQGPAFISINLEKLHPNITIRHNGGIGGSH
jgi:hypothetical protein